MRSGGWTEVDPSWMLGTEVTGKTVGVVGFGRIGQFARRARGFDLRVLYASPRGAGVTWAERVSLDELLTQSDFVSLHVPLTSASQDLLSRDRIALLKPGAIVVNTARGGVLDDVALAEALAEGRVGAAGLDVFRTSRAYPRLTSDSRTSSSRRTSGRAHARPGRPWRGWRSRTRRASGGAAAAPPGVLSRGASDGHGGRGAERAPSSAGRGCAAWYSRPPRRGACTLPGRPGRTAPHLAGEELA